MKRRTVSLCMITRDEEAAIGQAIKSVMALVDEIVVVDLGSRDNTRIIAEGYGGIVLDHPWGDDFAAARNVALTEASGEWILVLDPRERLLPVRPVEFQRLLRDENVAGYRLRCGSGTDLRDHVLDPCRLFRNVPRARYRYPACERMTPALQEWAAAHGLSLKESSLAVRWEAGPRAAEIRDRLRAILRGAIRADEREPYFEYRLGGFDLCFQDHEVLPVAGMTEAVRNLARAWRKSRALPADQQCCLEYGHDLAAILAAGQLAAGHPWQALRTARAGRRLHGERPGLLLQAIAAGVAVLTGDAREHGELASGSARRLLAAIRRDIDRLGTEWRGLPDDADGERLRGLYPLRYRGELALNQGKVSEAAELFERALTRDNGYTAAWLGLAECARYAGDRKRALKLYLRAVTENEWNAAAWLRGSSLLAELGFHDNAASWCRKAAALFPEHPRLPLETRASAETPILPDREEVASVAPSI
jgi:tetratricopeptide (TPR) repeat protein